MSTNATVLEGTQVIFVCSADSNPVTTLSVIQIRDTEEVLAQQISNTWTMSIILTKEHHGLIFICRANGSDPVFSVDSSDRYKFDVKCKCIYCSPIIV